MSISRAKQNEIKERADTVSDMYGLKVYTETGVYIGIVKDIRVDFEKEKITGVLLKDLNKEVVKTVTEESTNEIVIPYTWINSIHDIVLISDII